MRSTPLLAVVAFACTAPPEHRDGGGQLLPDQGWQELRAQAALDQRSFAWIERPLVPGLDPSWQALSGLGRVYVGERGLTVVDRRQAEPEWRVDLELSALGRGATLRAPGPATLWADGTSFEALHDGVVEYVEQEPDGLEHGFRVLEDPGGSGPLVLELTVRGARPYPLPDGAAFLVPGRARVDWRGLAVFDADHQRLEAHTQVDGEHLRVVIEDRSAPFPWLVDPTLTVWEADVVGTGGPDPSAFGFSIASDGDHLVGGDPGTLLANDGVAHVVERNQGGRDAWGAEGAPLRLDGNFLHQGFAVAIEGEQVAVSSEQAGRVSTFRPDGAGDWAIAETFTVPGGDFGWSVELEDRSLYVGAPGDSGAGQADSGAVWIYAFDRYGVRQSLKVLPPWWGGRFGEAISVSDSHLAVAAPQRRSVVLYRSDTLPGGAQPDLVWEDSGPIGSGFGASVALDHDLLAVGAPGDQAVVVYQRLTSTPVETWGREVVVQAPPGAQAGFGTRVALTTDTLAVTDLPVGQGMARVHLFERRGPDAWGWVESFDAGLSDGAPLPVTLQPTLLAVGVPEEGALRAWRRTGEIWQETVLQGQAGPAPDYGQDLGSAVAVSGDLVVVGARFDDETAPSAGKIYAYVHEGPGSWDLRDTRNGAAAWELYGSSLDAADDLVAVGAPGADPGGSVDAGRAEVVRFGGDALELEQPLVAFMPSGRFGESVALDQELVVVGEPGNNAGGTHAYVRSLSNAHTWNWLASTPADEAADEAGMSVAVWDGWVFAGGYDARGHGEVRVDTVTTLQAGAPVQILSRQVIFDGFGDSLAVDAGVLAVGASGTSGGEVYLYELTRTDPASWIFTHVLTGRGAASGFGSAVALRGDDLFVGARYERVVYHHRRNQDGPDNWGLVETWAGQVGVDDFFGEAVDSDDATLVIGAPSSLGLGAGSVHLLELGADLPPVAEPDLVEVPEDEAIVVAAPGVLENDHDPHGTAVTVTRVLQPPAHDAQFALNPDGGLTYRAELNYFGPDSFVYEVADASGETTTATAVIDVTPVNDLPVAVADGPYLGQEDQLLASAPQSVLANDTDVDLQPLTAVVEDRPASGLLDLDTDGTFRYAPQQDQFGEVTFTYRAVDSEGGRSEPVTVILRLAPDNDPPVVPARMAPTTLDEDDRHLASHPGLLDADPSTLFDPDGDPLTAALATPPAHGAATVAPDGSWSYVPAHDYAGNDLFTFLVSDGSSTSAEIDVPLLVQQMNDRPLAVEDGPFHTREDTVLLLAAPTLVANDVDVEEGTLGVQLDLTVVPTLGRVDWDGKALTVVYTPDPDVVGTDVFAYRAVDLDGLLSEPVEVTVEIDAVNDPPVAVDDNPPDFVRTTTGNVLANDSDPDDGVLTALLLTQPIGGTLELEPDGDYTYTADPSFEGRDPFTYLALDANGGRSAPALVELVVRGEEGPVDTGEAPCEPTTWFADADGDGFGDADQHTDACEAPPEHVEDDTDCDDTRAAAFPGAAEELGDGLDQDCDGVDNDLGVAGSCDTAPGSPWWGGLALVAVAARRRPSRTAEAGAREPRSRVEAR